VFWNRLQFVTHSDHFDNTVLFFFSSLLLTPPIYSLPLLQTDAFGRIVSGRRSRSRSPSSDGGHAKRRSRFESSVSVFFFFFLFLKSSLSIHISLSTFPPTHVHQLFLICHSRQLTFSNLYLIFDFNSALVLVLVLPDVVTEVVSVTDVTTVIVVVNVRRMALTLAPVDITVILIEGVIVAVMIDVLVARAPVTTGIAPPIRPRSIVETIGVRVSIAVETEMAVAQEPTHRIPRHLCYHTKCGFRTNRVMLIQWSWQKSMESTKLKK